MIEAVVPMYNEQDGCAGVARRLDLALKATGEEYAIYFMVGGDDDTYARLFELCVETRNDSFNIQYDGERGLGTAIRLGLSKVTDKADYVLTIDGDGQCVPEEFAKLWSARGHDLTAGYQAPGFDSRGKVRRFESFCATRLLKMRYGVKIRSLTLNYRLYDAEAVRKVRGSLRSRDFAIQPEIVVALAKAGYHDFESVPVSWPPRAHGGSHARVTAKEYLRLLL